MQATLLGQLKTLQKKDEQLREVLLILLRAPSADVAYGQQRQQPPSNGISRHGSSQAKTAARRADAGAAAAAATADAATSGAAARLAPLPSRFPDSSSARSLIPVRLGTGSAKTVSLHDALGISPPETAAARAGSEPRDGSGGFAGGSSSSPALSTRSVLTYRPGQHALYRLTNNKSGGGGGHGGGKGAVGRNASSGAGASDPAPGSGDGGRPSGTAARADDRSGERAASRTAERGKFSSSSSSPSPSSLSSCSAARIRAQPSSTGGSSTATTLSAVASSVSGGGASASGALPSSSNAEVGESGSGGDGTSSTPKRPARESREAAAAKVNMKIKEELIEDMQDDIEREVSSTVADNSNRLLVTGVQTAAAAAAARVAMALAARPRDPTKPRVAVCFEVKKEMNAAVEAAVTTTVSDKPDSILATVLKRRVGASAVHGWRNNFEIQDGGGVKRKAAERRSRLARPPPPRSRTGSDAVRVVEPISIDGTGDDEDDRISRPSKPPPSRNEVELLGAAAEPARGTAEAESAERQPAEAPSADGQQGGPGDGGEKTGEQPHQPGPASLSAEAFIRDMALATFEAPEPRAPSVESAVPTARRARKRRKSAEAGGWRSRYNKNEFESGDALLASSSDGEGEDEDWMGAGKRRASRHGGGDDADAENAESDELVDVGVEGDDDDLRVYGGGGGRARNPKGVVELVKKRSPPNAWKRRCADGDCQLGASFGMPGKSAKYCSAHKDAGMVNVTHRRCEEPRCVRGFLVVRGDVCALVMWVRKLVC